MTESNKQIFFSHQELVAMMIKDLGIHEGHWVVSAMLGFAPLNISPPENQGESYPSGAVVVQKLGLQKVDSPTPTSVDASVVNPATPVARKAAGTKTTKKS